LVLQKEEGGHKLCWNEHNIEELPKQQKPITPKVFDVIPQYPVIREFGELLISEEVKIALPVMPDSEALGTNRISCSNKVDIS